MMSSKQPTFRGSFGVVSVYWSQKHGMHVASKSVRTSSPACVLNELQCLDILHCDHDTHVIPLVDASRKEGELCLVFPYIEHMSFRRMISTLEEHEPNDYMKSLLTAVSFVHSKGIVHRDIKPSNFLYSRALRRGWLIDFGLAEQHFVWHTRSCQSQTVGVLRGEFGHRMKLKDVSPNLSGTPGYKAPETLCASIQQGTAIDIFASGIVLASLLFQRFPLLHRPSSGDDIHALIQIMQLISPDEVIVAANSFGKTIKL